VNTHPQQSNKKCLKQFFRNVPEWSALEATDLQCLERAVNCRIYKVGENIYQEGESASGIHFIKSGLIGIRKAALDGYSTLLKIARKGDALGLRALSAEESHRATAKVLKPGLICFVDAETIRPVIQHNHTLGNSLLKHTAHDLGEADERYHEIATRSLRSRLAHLLLLLQEKDVRTNRTGILKYELPVSRTDLAAMLGVRRESVSRAIHEFEQEGLVHFMDRLVEIPDQKSLLAEFSP